MNLNFLLFHLRHIDKGRQLEDVFNIILCKINAFEHSLFMVAWLARCFVNLWIIYNSSTLLMDGKLLLPSWRSNMHAHIIEICWFSGEKLRKTFWGEEFFIHMFRKISNPKWPLKWFYLMTHFNLINRIKKV